MTKETVYNKIPPNASDLEKAVLGACMLGKDGYEQVQDILTENSFYILSHQKIYNAITRLAASNQPIDELTVMMELVKTNELGTAGGPVYLTQCTKAVVSTANTERHARYIQEKFIHREIIAAGGSILGLGYDESKDIFDMLDEAEKLVLNISSGANRSGYSHGADAIMEVVKKIEYLKTLDSSITGVPSGFPSMDTVTMGWQPTDLIILAARPSVGKTAFALNLVRNALLAGKPVGMFSLEMSKSQLMERLISTDSGIYLERIKKGLLDGEFANKFNASIGRLSKLPLYIDDTAALSVFEFRAKARRMVRKHKVEFIIVDYLQLMSDGSKKNGNRENEISTISRTLKQVAKELNIPIIALSQLSREVEKRPKGHRIPQLSDLRESGSIEQDADMVTFIYRPPSDEVKDNPELAGTGMIKIAKHRNGELADLPFKFYGATQTWQTVEQAAEFDRNNPVKPLKSGTLFNNDSFMPVVTSEEDDMPF